MKRALAIGAALACGLAAPGLLPAHAAGPTLLLAGRRVQALAAFGGMLYAGTDGGLFSAHPGGPWAPAAGPLANGNVNALAAPGGVLLAGYDGGVLATSDGAHWSGPTLSGQPVASLSAAGGTALAGTGTSAGGNGAVYRSDDGGRSWQPAVGLPAAEGLPGSEVQALLLRPAGPALAGTAGDGVYRSTTGAGSWTGPAAGVEYPWVTSFAVAADGSLLAGTDNLLYRSTDAGASWAEAPFPQQFPWIQALAPEQGAVVAGTFDGAVYSGGPGAAGGGAWHEVAGGLPEVLAVLAIAPGQYLVGTGDGLFCAGCTTAAGGRPASGAAAATPRPAASLPPPSARPATGEQAGVAPSPTSTASIPITPVPVSTAPGSSLPGWVYAVVALVVTLAGICGAWWLRTGAPGRPPRGDP